MGDRVRASLDLDRLCGLQAAVAQLLEQREQPAFTRQRGGVVALWKRGQRRSERLPRRHQSVPGTSDPVVQALTLHEVVGLGRQSGNASVVGGYTCEQIGWQQATFRADRRELGCA